MDKIRQENQVPGLEPVNFCHFLSNERWTASNQIKVDLWAWPLQAWHDPRFAILKSPLRIFTLFRVALAYASDYPYLRHWALSFLPVYESGFPLLPGSFWRSFSAFFFFTGLFSYLFPDEFFRWIPKLISCKLIFLSWGSFRFIKDFTSFFYFFWSTGLICRIDIPFFSASNHIRLNLRFLTPFFYRTDNI